jgi:hypothetical protein
MCALEVMKMNYSQLKQQAEAYKRMGFDTEERREFITGKKNIFNGHSRWIPTKEKDGFNVWYEKDGKPCMFHISHEDFLIFYDDEFEVDEQKLEQILSGIKNDGGQPSYKKNNLQVGLKPF